MRPPLRVSRLWPWVAAALASAPAVASGEAGGDVAMAETLFQEGKARMAAKDYATACPKLAESNRLDPGTGILLALAICHEEWGKTATAWAEFTEVMTMAHKENRADRESFARQHVAALARVLSRLTIEVPAEAADVPGLQVKKDGVVLGSAAWGTPVPTDPGSHGIEVTAPGRVSWQTTVDVEPGGSGRTVRVVVPSLEPPSARESAASDLGAVPATLSSVSEAASRKRVAGYAVGALGIAGIGLGTYFGVETISKNNDAKALCSPPRCANPTAVSDSSSARTFADLADVGFGVGVAGLGVATYLLLTSHSTSSSSAGAPLHVTPLAGPTFAGALLERTF